ncbi:MAG: sulfite exporter TauE/SafE family protein [Candidatus Hodarchaeales archaeon]
MSLLQFIGDPIVTDPIQGLLAAVFAFFVGIISSALGVGGGFITTPSLIIVGIGEAYAIGTVLFMIIFTALSSTIAYSRQKNLIEYRTGLLIATTTIIGSISGSITSSILAVEDPQLFRIIFALCLFPISIKMIFYPKERKSANAVIEEIEHDEIIIFGFEKRELWSTAFGLLAGFSSGLLGIGGGVVMVPILVTLGKMPMHKAVATSMFIMIFTSIAGAGVKFTNGQVHPDLAIFLVIGIIIGAQIGARLVKRVNTIALQKIFGIMMIVALISIVL